MDYIMKHRSMTGSQTSSQHEVQTMAVQQGNSTAPGDVMQHVGRGDVNEEVGSDHLQIGRTGHSRPRGRGANNLHVGRQSGKLGRSHYSKEEALGLTRPVLLFPDSFFNRKTTFRRTLNKYERRVSECIVRGNSCGQNGPHYNARHIFA